MSIYDTLNEQQKEAVLHTEGPLLILAGAGSGKTRVLTHRIAYLIEEQGVNPWNILAITFTNKAAGEMRERVDKLVGFGAESIWVSTFHSTCVRILRRHIDLLGYDNNFTIYDSDDQKTLMKDVCKLLQIDTKIFKERALLGTISHAKDELITPEEFRIRAEGDFSQKKIAEVYEEYEKQLRANNALDFDALEEKLGAHCFSMIADYVNAPQSSKVFNERIRDRICELSVKLAKAKDVHEFKEDMTSFYKDFGVGKFGLHKAFRVAHNEDGVQIVPITKIAHVHLDDLVGYELAKKKLIENTEAFVQGRKSNNCLLFGDSGTGKSTSIKAIVNEYYDQGLRMIEIYKHQFKDLSNVIAMIKNRNYKFIIYMDDLSFEDYELEYKYLKAILEGGLGKRPGNVLIYATSNRRHLIREKFSDKRELDDELHNNDTVQEKLSLAARFGVTIYYGSPDKRQFETIVKALADRHGLDMPEQELFAEANKWELSHGGLSGRTAAQFITHLKARQ